MQCTASNEKPGDNLLSRKRNIIGGLRLTTVFGMGTGMAKDLWSPGIRLPRVTRGMFEASYKKQIHTRPTARRSEEKVAKPIARLVPVS